MNEAVSLWIEVPVALLLAMSGVFTLLAAVGLVRFKSFFQACTRRRGHSACLHGA